MVITTIEGGRSLILTFIVHTTLPPRYLKLEQLWPSRGRVALSGTVLKPTSSKTGTFYLRLNRLENPLASNCRIEPLPTHKVASNMPAVIRGERQESTNQN